MASKIYTVTVATGSSYGGGTGNVYFLDGVRNATGPGTVDWVAGATIRFDQNDSSNNNHPLVFSTNTSTSGIISANVTYYLDGSSNQANYTNTATFNSATTRYVEITPSSQTDFYYLCYVHGIGMGGVMNMTQDTWSALAWNDGQWGDQDNITLQLSGFPLPMGLGDESSTPSSGWSSHAWGDNSWGNTNNFLQLTGQLLTSNLGTLDAVFPSSGWGGESWSEGQWGSVGTGNQVVTGFDLAVAVGTVGQTSSTGWGRSTWGSQVWNGFADVILQGQVLTATVGDELINTDINSGWGGSPWGHTGWGAYGNAFISGNSISATLSSVIIDNEINTGWGSDGWGVEGWGESILTVTPTGIAMTAFEGSAGLSFDGDSNLIATGNSLTIAAPATVEAFAAFVAEPTGFSMGMTLGFDQAVIPASGFAMTATLGTAIADNITIADVSAKSASTWGYKSSWGFGVYGNQQVNTLTMSMLENFSGVDPAPDAEVTGQAMAMTLSPISNFDIRGDANIAPLAAMGWSDATWSESTWGDGLYRPDTDDIFPMTMSLGTATLDANTIPTITGLTNLFTAVGNVTEISGDANVIPTGFGLTFSLGTATNVLIWNEVNTGTAPVDPPGWQEVSTNAA